MTNPQHRDFNFDTKVYLLSPTLQPITNDMWLLGYRSQQTHGVGYRSRRRRLKYNVVPTSE